MKFNQIKLPLFLILSICSQSIVAHGELFKFDVGTKKIDGQFVPINDTCAKAKNIANIFVPNYEDLIENFCSDEVAVSVPVPVAKDKKVELTKKDLAKLVLLGADFSRKVQHNMHHNKHHFQHALVNALKSVGYEVGKDKLIGFFIDQSGSLVTVPEHAKNNKFFAAACYAASKAAGFALDVAIDHGYEAGKAWLFHKR